MTEKRGRPKKSTNTFDVNGLLAEYLSTKTDKYDNEISYFKLIDKNLKGKMSAILSQQCDECKLPFWKTEDHEYILKVKKRHTPKNILDVNAIVTVDMTFKHYCMETNEDKLLQGFYCKVNSFEDDKENNN